MADVSILNACLIACGVVFALLALLAVVTYIITAAFGEQEPETDPAVVAAINTAVASLVPGAKVIRIEKEP